MKNIHEACVQYGTEADKEFRYLRTVIVTAAVYRGFNSTLLLADDISS